VNLRMRAAVVVAAVVWAFVVFQITLWLTFPSHRTAAFLVHQIATRGGGYTAELGSVSPWWTGVSMRDVKVYGPATSSEPGEPAVPTLVALADRVRARVSPLSLLWGEYNVRGDVRLVEGSADYAFGLAPDDRGRVLLSHASVYSASLPLEEILPLLPLADAPTGTGALMVDIDIEAGEEGLRQATGHVSITGTNLVIADLSTESTGPLGMDLPIADLKIEAPIQEGRATISQGIATGELATIEVEGDLVLRDPLSRSSLDLRLLVSNLGPSLKPMAGLLGTPHSDGKYHFQVRGLVSRPSVTPLRETSASPSTRVPSSGSSRTPETGATPSPYPSSSIATETEEEREKRREEARLRLQERRAERDREAEAIREARGGPPVEDEDEDPSHVEEPEDVEQILPDEVGPDDPFTVEDADDWGDPQD
jgi:type II secretion system protein N